MKLKNNQDLQMITDKELKAVTNEINPHAHAKLHYTQIQIMA